MDVISVLQSQGLAEARRLKSTLEAGKGEAFVTKLGANGVCLCAIGRLCNKHGSGVGCLFGQLNVVRVDTKADAMKSPIIPLAKSTCNRSIRGTNGDLWIDHVSVDGTHDVLEGRGEIAGLIMSLVAKESLGIQI